eukprot:GHVU01230192.1.p3 GENE.GHVU01230192.1~~GHVU01230192.1.p3  ORF type:complete len:128 (-),score=10.19 GHVU01230192.1:2219-2602(-)
MGDRSGSEAPQPAAVEEVSGASGRETSRDPKRTRLRSNQKTPSVRKAVETHEEDCCNPSRMRIYIYIYRERERERETEESTLVSPTIHSVYVRMRVNCVGYSIYSSLSRQSREAVPPTHPHTHSLTD